LGMWNVFIVKTWADAFRGEPELKEFVAVYEELKEKGCEFPMTDLDNIPPIHTPARVTVHICYIYTIGPSVNFYQASFEQSFLRCLLRVGIVENYEGFLCVVWWEHVGFSGTLC